MALFFTPAAAASILAGTQTRTMRCRRRALVKVGGVYKAKVLNSGNRPGTDSTFARIKIVSIRAYDDLAYLGEILDDDYARKEGFENIEAFWEVFLTLNAVKMCEKWRKYYIIDFEVVS